MVFVKGRGMISQVRQEAAARDRAQPNDRLRSTRLGSRRGSCTPTFEGDLGYGRTVPGPKACSGKKNLVRGDSGILGGKGGRPPLSFWGGEETVRFIG